VLIQFVAVFTEPAYVGPVSNQLIENLCITASERAVLYAST